jgi:hypothetical protein
MANREDWLKLLEKIKVPHRSLDDDADGDGGSDQDVKITFIRVRDYNVWNCTSSPLYVSIINA